MEAGLALDLFGDALWRIVVIVTVIVVPGLIVGLIVSVFQAATQINEQTLSFLPRLIVTLLAIMWAGSWIIVQISDLFNFLFMNIPTMLR